MLDSSKVKELLQQDGYFDAVTLIETLEGGISRKAEYLYLKAYVEQSCFDEDICRDRLRMLWTAYCLHHELFVDTSEYDRDLTELWSKMSEIGDGTSDWNSYSSFDFFMCRYLV